MLLSPFPDVGTLDTDVPLFSYPPWYPPSPRREGMIKVGRGLETS